MKPELFQNRYRVRSIRLPHRDYAAPGYYFVTFCTKHRRHSFGEVVNGAMQLSAIGRMAHQFWFEIPSHFDGVRIDESVIMPNHVHGIVVIERKRWGDLSDNHAVVGDGANHTNNAVVTDDGLHRTNNAMVADDDLHHTNNVVDTLQCNVSTGVDTHQRHIDPPNGDTGTADTHQRYTDRATRQQMSKISPAPGSLGAIIRSYKSAVARWCRQNGHDHFAWQPRFYEHIIRNDGSIHRIRRYIRNNPAKWHRDRHHSL